METSWALVVATEPLMVRVAGDETNVPMPLTNGDTYAIGDKVALIRVGTRWWVAGRIADEPSGDYDGGAP